MWFASIWIFTLGLPWQLGADFFLRHLLDGDAAVNTLSWRWVAGIQTQGKTYLADADNIAQFTEGRFVGVTGLAPSAPPVPAPPLPPRRDISRLAPYTGAPSDRAGLLLNSDDLMPPDLAKIGVTPVSTAYFDGTALQSPWHTAPMISTFRKALACDIAPDVELLANVQSITDWAKAQQLDQVIIPHTPVGPVRTALRAAFQTSGIPITEVRREIDSAAWPLATAGFFKFRKHIPDLLARFAGHRPSS